MRLRHFIPVVTFAALPLRMAAQTTPLRSGINTADLHYFTLVSGSFNIYDYDCGCTISETVEGIFNVFYADGIVFFVKAE